MQVFGESEVALIMERGEREIRGGRRTRDFAARIGPTTTRSIPFEEGTPTKRVEK